MNLGEIVQNVNTELHPATNIDTVIKRWANRAQKKFVSKAEVDFTWLRLNDLTLTTVANQSEYVLSTLVDTSKIMTIRDPTRMWMVRIISEHEFQEKYPNPVMATSDPTVAYLSGYSAVQAQPTSASTLSLVSSASDNSVVKIEGLNAAGVLIGEEITLNGTSAVTSVNSYQKILGRSINGFLSGILTITSNAGAVTVAVIGPRQRQGLHPKVILYPCPGTIKTLYYDATMLLPDMVNNNDTSLIPEKFHDAIEDYCLYRGYRHKKDLEMSQEAKQAFEERVMDAVRDDRGPSRQIQVGGSEYSSYLGDGTFPGLYPRGF
jgi:hypothetical protein